MYPRQDPVIDTFKCQYHQKKGEKSPHNHIAFDYERKKIYNNILEVIGNTPMVKLNKIPQSEGVECNFYAKCEFLNPGGSLKDRIGYRMLLEAELSGRSKPGETLIEATSGNTGIGLALAAAVKGYNIHITLPEKMSTEKTDVLSALGAKIHRTPTEAAFDDPRSHIAKAINLNKELPNSHILDQYINPGNTLAHYDGTGAEIAHQLSGDVDYVFIGTGTGGTIAGIGRKLKEQVPKCKIIGVDPHGSILAMPQSLNTRNDSYLMEGIGYDFIPRAIDRTVVDDWVKVDDPMALPMTRRIIREEGMLCGGSSGAVLSSALQYCKQNNIKGKNIVVLFADNIRNYLSKFVSDEWMVEKGFYNFNTLNNYVSSDKLKDKKLDSIKLEQVSTFKQTQTIEEVYKYNQTTQHPQILITNNENQVIAATSQNKLIEYILNKNLSPSDTLEKIWTKDYSLFKYEDVTLHGLAQLLTKRSCVFLQKSDGHHYILLPSQILNFVF